MDILITGATGLIGAVAIRRLSQTHRVYALARRRPTGPEARDASWIECDLGRPWETTALPEGIDVVIHLVQSRRFREFPEGAGDMFEVNIASTMRLLAYAHQAGARLSSPGDGAYMPQP